MKLLKLCALSTFIFLGLNACSSTENVGNEIAERSSVFPSWYQNAEFSSDSLGYSGFGTAIGADSAKAIERADMQARIYLEKRIAQLTEEVRTDLVQSGSKDAENTDFIIILRTAHSNVVEAANSVQSVSRKTDGYYRGFASVEISKDQLKSVLEQGFKGHPRYWGAFSASPTFVKYF